MASSILGKRSVFAADLSSNLVVPSQRRRIDRNDVKSANFTIHEDAPIKAKPAIASESVRNTSDLDIELHDAENASEGQTPSTPRHRDNINKQFTTPRHRVGSIRFPVTPRTPKTPSSSHRLTRPVFAEARKAFARGTEGQQVIGRERERKELRDFITKKTDEAHGGALYVSGPPGTGKSALISEVLLGYADSEALQSAYINCMGIKSASELYQQLCAELGVSCAESNAETAFRQCAINGVGERAPLVVLDEIDQLLLVDSEVIYQLFDLSMQDSSNLALIGIANALDLTDRLLPRLKSRDIRPQLLPVMPYTAKEIEHILSSRARSLLPADSNAVAGYIPFLVPQAITLISKKVSAQSGDIRKALDIAQRTIDLVEAETRHKIEKEENAVRERALGESPSKHPLSENTNLSSPLGSPSKNAGNAYSPSKLRASISKIPPSPSSLTATPTTKALTSETAPRATLAHVIKVTSSAFNNGTATRLKTLNLQQKAILCALTAMERRRLKSLHNEDNSSQSRAPPSPLATPHKHAKFSFATTSSPKRFTSSSTSSAAEPPSAPTVAELFSSYTSLCNEPSSVSVLGDASSLLQPLSKTEFRDVLGHLETLSMIAPADGRGSFCFNTPTALLQSGSNTKSKRKFASGMASLSSTASKSKKKMQSSSLGEEGRRIAACAGSAEELMELVRGEAGDGLLRAILSR